MTAPGVGGGRALASAILGAVLILGSVQGCASNAASARSIVGNWQLVHGSDTKGIFSPGTSVVTFKFNGEKSSGRGPCNAFGATAKGTRTGTISISVGIHTEMACVADELNTTESRYFAALDAVTTASLAGGTLTLSGSGDSLVFTRATK